MENIPVNVFAYNLSCFLGFPVSYDDVLDMKEVFLLWNFEKIEDLLSFIKDNKIGWYEEWTEVSYKVYEELKEKGEASALETEKVEKEIENRYFFNPKTNNLFKKLEEKTDTVKE